MGQALYRKYRPKSLSEVVGQEHITKVLAEAFTQNRISHAYLFTGPRGVGKTTVARILAHEINNLPYEDDSIHLDIIEIDAASNRRIDEIRDLRDKVHIAPTSAKYKVYIIDEVHMLTREAFNALLKTLEEPPSHVVFVLATTEASKLPETIISRTQRFNFKPVETNKVVTHLRSIAEKEKMTVSDDALDLIAEHGEGSFRDSISLLDQAANSQHKVAVADVEALLGLPSKTAIDGLKEAVVSDGSTSTIVNLLAGLYQQGFQASALAKHLSEILRSDLIGGRFEGVKRQDVLRLLHRLLEVPVSINPERYLEIVLLESGMNFSVNTKSDRLNGSEISKDDLTAPSEKTSDTKLKKSQETKPQPSPKRTSKTEQTVELIKLDNDAWPKVLEEIKHQYNTLYGILKEAEVKVVDDSTVELIFGFAFYQKRMSDTKNSVIVKDVIYKLTGKKVEINCLGKNKVTALENSAEPTLPVDDAVSDNVISAISNIFGGGELLES